MEIDMCSEEDPFEDPAERGFSFSGGYEKAPNADAEEIARFERSESADYPRGLTSEVHPPLERANSSPQPWSDNFIHRRRSPKRMLRGNSFWMRSRQNSEYNAPNCNEDSQGDLFATSLPSEISGMPDALLARSPQDSAGSRYCQSPERGAQPSQGEALLATSPPSSATAMEQPTTPPRSIAKLECDDSDCVTPLLVGLRTPNVECAQNSSFPAFSILRPLSNIPSKRVFLVRHGESEYNFALANNKAWEDPQVFDAPLTEKGVRQAKSLRVMLSNIPNIESALWVCSPLTRAVETMLHGCPVDVDDLVASGRLIIRSEVSEFLQTTSDIGLPASMLRQKFPRLTGAMEDLSEKWWFGDPKNNDLLTKRCEEFETKESERNRINNFRQFLEGRPESVVICFGHSLFWKHFSGSKDVLDHCAMMRMRL